jgi:hypothetical protein
MKKQFLLFCFISAYHISCSNCEKLNLSSSEKEWVNHYQVGQKFIFKNSIGKIDTLIVKDTSNYYTPCNKVELSKYQYEIYLVIFLMKSQSNYNNDESSISMTTQEWEQRIPYIHFGNLGLHRNDLQNKMPPAIDTVLNGVKLISVYYYAKGLNTEQYGKKEFFKNFFWSKELGLMAYTTENNDIFLRTSK